MAPAAPDMRPVLAVLEVTNEGPTKGQQYELRVPLSHVGRGAHNDISIADESVSDTHAKLQRRDDGWYVVDAGSTNGTYVGGHRIDGERKLEGAPDVRFGGVKMIFRPRDVATDVAKGTRAIASVDRSKLRATAAVAGSPQSTAKVPSPAASSAPISEPSPRQGIPVWVWAVVLLAVAAVVFFLMKR
jgi:pSer/pThr/pTyr-binding forkhead associated (FHA) protein